MYCVLDIQCIFDDVDFDDGCFPFTEGFSVVRGPQVSFPPHAQKQRKLQNSISIPQTFTFKNTAVFK